MSVTVKTEQYDISRRPVPLKAVRVSGEVQNLSLSLSFTQCYSSPQHPLKEGEELVFEFPLYDLGVVKAFKVTVNDDEVPAQISLKSEVNDLYGAENHNFKTFKHYNATDLFVCHLANVPPNSHVEITLQLAATLTVIGELVVLVLPTSISPRCNYHETSGKTMVSQEFQYELNLLFQNMFAEVQTIYSPTHLIRSTIDGTRGQLGLVVGERPISDSDIFIYFSFRDALPSHSVRTSINKDESTHVFSIALKPHYDNVILNLNNRYCERGDILFVVDMHYQIDAQYIVIALKAGLEAIKGKDLYFNIILTTHPLMSLYDEPTRLNQASYDDACAFLTSERFLAAFRKRENSLSLSYSIEKILSENVRNYGLASILLLSTSQTARPTKLIYSFNEYRSFYQVYPISIGPNFNFYALNTIAQTTRGFYDFVPFPSRKNSASSASNTPSKSTSTTTSSNTSSQSPSTASNSGDTANSNKLTQPVESEAASIDRRIVLSVQQQIFRMLQPKVEKVSVSWGSMSDNVLQVPAEIFIRSDDVVQFCGLLPYPLVENTAVTVTAHFKEGNVLQIVIPLIPSEFEVEEQPIVEVQVVSDRYLTLLQTLDATDELNERTQLEEEADALALEYSIATSTTSFWGKQEIDGVRILLASCSDYDFDDDVFSSPEEDPFGLPSSLSAQGLASERNLCYSLNYLMGFKDCATDKPEDIPNFMALVGLSSSDDGHSPYKRRPQNIKTNVSSIPINVPSSRDPSPIPQQNSASPGGNRWRSNKLKALTGEESSAVSPINSPVSNGPTSGGGGPKSWGSGQSPLDKLFKRTAVPIATAWDEQNDPSTKEFYKLMNSTLNKLTRDNYANLLAKILAMHTEVSTVGRLNSVASMVFEKGILSQQYATMFVDLINDIKDKFRKFETDIGEVDFRRALLKKCQEEFEKERPEALGPNPTEDEMEKETKARERQQGSINFIGELFNAGLIGSRVIHANVCRGLLGIDEDEDTPVDPKNLLLACKLLTTIGKQLDSDDIESYQDLEEYIKFLTGLLNTDKIEVKVKVSIQNLIDLRESDWNNSRTGKKEVKTIEEFHRAEKQKKLDNEKKIEQMRIAGSAGRGMGIPHSNSKHHLSKSVGSSYELIKPNKRDSPGKLMRDSDGSSNSNTRRIGEGYRNSPGHSHSSSNLMSCSPSKYNNHGSNNGSNTNSGSSNYHFRHMEKDLSSSHQHHPCDSLSSSPGDEDESRDSSSTASSHLTGYSNRVERQNSGSKEKQRNSGERSSSIDKTIALTVSPRGRHMRQGSGEGKVQASRSEGDVIHTGRTSGKHSRQGSRDAKAQQQQANQSVTSTELKDRLSREFGADSKEAAQFACCPSEYGGDLVRISPSQTPSRSPRTRSHSPREPYVPKALTNPPKKKADSTQSSPSTQSGGSAS